MLFYGIPIIIGIAMPIFFREVNDKVAGVLNSYLTSFIPLFATILTFYLSWCYNKIKSRHNKERLQLFRETSTNILMMIPLDVFAILSYVFASNTLLGNSTIVPDAVKSMIPESCIVLSTLTWHQVIRYVFLIAYYLFVSETILIIFMVCKRAYVIINNEITLLTEDGEGDNIARAKSLIDDASAFLEKEL